MEYRCSECGGEVQCLRVTWASGDVPTERVYECVKCWAKKRVTDQAITIDMAPAKEPEEEEFIRFVKVAEAPEEILTFTPEQGLRLAAAVKDVRDDPVARALLKIVTLLAVVTEGFTEPDKEPEK